LSAALMGAAALSACGKLGELEQAPPVFNKKAEASWSASKNPDGGSTVTMEATSSRATERALPDANDKNKMENPYTAPKRIQDAPLEGFGNATSFNNSPNK
ncbi:MAG: hypothetical protein WBQ60_07295, partial [Asticcacaulis sp.]